MIYFTWRLYHIHWTNIYNFMLHVLSGPSAVEVKQPPSSSCPNHSMQGTVCFFRNPCLSLTSKKKRGPLKPSSLFPAASSVRFISLSLSLQLQHPRTSHPSIVDPTFCHEGSPRSGTTKIIVSDSHRKAMQKI